MVRMKIILLGGKANTGKDSTAEYIDEYYRSRGLDVVNIQIGYYIKMYAKEIAKWDGDNETKPRQLLQDLGTELIRKQIDEYFFIKRIIQDIDIYSRYFDIITISDGRLPEEFAAIKLAYPETVTVHVTRPGFTSRLTKDQKAHVTEALVDDIEYDYDIVNDGTLEDLQKKEYIDAMIKSFNECLEKIKYPTNFIDSEILQDTIEDLRNNPNAFELEDCNDTPKNTLMIPRCKPSKQLSKFMEYIYNNELMDKEYLENYEKIKDKEIKYMNYNEIITSLTFFLRGERFCGGFWYTNFKNGRILKILVRLKELEDGNRK